MTTTTQIAEALAAANAALAANRALLPWEQADPTSLPAVIAAVDMVEARLVALMGWDAPVQGVNGAVLCPALADATAENMDEAILREHGLEIFIGRTLPVEG